MKDMTLKIKNFGPINDAKLDIGKINVIAGANASGKTTTSKLFYCLLASSSSDGKYLANKGIANLLSPLIVYIWQKAENNTEEQNKLLKFSNTVNNFDVMSDISLHNIYHDTFQIYEKLDIKNRNFLNEKFKEIDEILTLKENSEDYYIYVLSNILEIEFDGGEQIAENFTGEIQFFGKNDDFEFRNEIKMDAEGVQSNLSKDYFDSLGLSEVSYIETPYVLDFMGAISRDFPFSKGSDYHQKLLMRKLRDNSNKTNLFDDLISKNIIDFEKKIYKLIEGNFKYDHDSEDFKFTNGDHTFTIKNTSSGLKHIGIIQLLLKNRKLPKNSYLIMDEPEVHLHPEWQVKLAEILVLLARDLNITLYINSHSPHFIEAIEVFSEYYDIGDVTNFYLTEKKENGKYNINKITKDNLIEIYNRLGKPYEDIDKFRGKIDAKNVIRGRD